MANGFDKFGFLEMLHAKYADCVRSAFMELLVEIVDDAYTSYNVSKDQLVLRLADELLGERQRIHPGHVHIHQPVRKQQHSLLHAGRLVIVIADMRKPRVNLA